MTENCERRQKNGCCADSHAGEGELTVATEDDTRLLVREHENGQGRRLVTERDHFESEAYMSPWKPKEACAVCQRVNCIEPTHTKEYRRKQYERDRRVRRPYISEDRRRRAECVKAWIDAHGCICPGFDRPPHPAASLEADHIIPVSFGGDPLGELQTLCHQCNVRRYAAMVRDGEGPVRSSHPHRPRHAPSSSCASANYRLLWRNINLKVGLT